MTSIKLIIRHQQVSHVLHEDSVPQLKNDLPTIIASTFPDSTMPSSSAFELFGGANGNSLSDVDSILGESMIFVFEIFTITPCPLFRTIQPNQIHPVIKSKHTDNRWSKMSPLYCGAFKKATAKAKAKSEITDGSPFYLNDSATMSVRGMSLKSVVAREERAELLDPVDENEGVGWTILSDLSTLSNEITPSDFGKLHTPMLIDSRRAPRYTVLHVDIPATNESKGKTPKGEKVIQKRMLFFAYELPANTNLEDLGMAVVYDNSDTDYAGHFTLIPWKRPMRELLIDELVFTDGVVATVDIPNDGCSAYADVDIVPNEIYRLFPLVAAQFQFHSMWMRGSAQIKEDLDEDNDSDKLILARGVAAFYNHLQGFHQAEDMFPLLARLISAEYDLSRLSKRDTHRLIKLFESVMDINALDEREYDDVGQAFDVVGQYLPPPCGCERMSIAICA